MRIDVLTLFPEMFEGVLGSSILARAARDLPDPAAPDDAGRVRPAVANYHLHQLRDWSADAKHRKVDAPPYGGGPGMVIQCQPVWDAVRAITEMDAAPPRRVLMTPKGRPLTQELCEQLAAVPRLLIIAGHYEGLDQRVINRLHEDAPEPRPGGRALAACVPETLEAAAGARPPGRRVDEADHLLEISVGDYVLSGGELPAMTLIDAVVRLLPGALGHADSARQDSFSPGVHRQLDHPHYTRPPEWPPEPPEGPPEFQGRKVPQVLLGGDHAKIEAWRAGRSRELTRQRRPDLLPDTLRPAVEFSGGCGGGGLAVVRDAGDGDVQAVKRVHAEAFPTDAEARLVERLLAGHDVIFSILAEAGGEVVGHVLCSRMTHADGGSVRGLVGLAPLAVLSGARRRGIGRALVREALRQASEHRVAAVFVLGDPDYYGPLGFAPASEHGLTSKYDAGDAFLVHLPPGRSAPPPGRVAYAPAFDGLD
jgi:tRNA (guanine37-N1)-methyltransferase